MKHNTLLALIATLVLVFALAGCASSSVARSSASSDRIEIASEPSDSAASSDSSAESAAAEETDDEADEQRENLPKSARDYVEALVWQNGLGELVSYSQYQNEDGEWILEVVTRGADGNEYTSVIGADGTVLVNGFEQANLGDETDGDADASYDDSDAGENAADGTGGIDANDNDSDIKSYSNKEAKQAVVDNGLGTYIYSQEVQGSDGNMYQEITTRDEDGNDSYSYLDSNGNVVYDVDVELRYNNDGTADSAKQKKKS